MILGGTLFLTLLMLPIYFIRKKKNPDNPKNTIKRLIIFSFIAVTIFSLLSGSGLIAMYIDDVKADNNSVAIIGGADGPTSVFIAGKLGDHDMGYTQINMEMAKTIFEESGDYIILDVRRADEFAKGHIPGAINVANEAIETAEPSELPDKNQTIYVYCRSGNRSKQAAQKLADMGYTNIIEFGGIIDWTGEITKD